MPVKKNGPTGGDDPPVEKKPAENPLEARHVELRNQRRALEAELAVIDEDLRAAINNADMDAIDKLDARKRDLPRLFIAASTAETKARQEILNTEDQANSERLQAAQAERDKFQAKLAKRKAEFEEEIAALTLELQETDRKIGALYSTIAAARNFGSDCDAGFKRSMAKLAGV